MSDKLCHCGKKTEDIILSEVQPAEPVSDQVDESCGSREDCFDVPAEAGVNRLMLQLIDEETEHMPGAMDTDEEEDKENTDAACDCGGTAPELADDGLELEYVTDDGEEEDEGMRPSSGYNSQQEVEEPVPDYEDTPPPNYVRASRSVHRGVFHSRVFHPYLYEPYL
jgi:hypothetical protein